MCRPGAASGVGLALMAVAVTAAGGVPGAGAHGGAADRSRTVYVDPVLGRDGNPGTSPERPWRTLRPVNAGHWRGGDRILLAAGRRFPATVRLGPGNLTRTSRASPLSIGAYGSLSRRRPVIAAEGNGIVITDVSGVRIDGLEVSGSDRDCRHVRRGIILDAVRPGGRLTAGLVIADTDVHGFCDGIAIGAEDDRSRIAHIRVTRTSVHDDGGAGFVTYDPANSRHDIADVALSRVRADRNAGQGGIALAGVAGAVVAHSEASANGGKVSGAVGIWAFDSDRVRLVHDVSRENRTTHTDGDGFDLDGGVTNSEMTDDLAYGNDGIGFLVCPCVPGYGVSNVRVARDTSREDGRSGQPSGFYLEGGGRAFAGVTVTGNTFVSHVGHGPVVFIAGGGTRGRIVTVTGNRIAAPRGKTLLDAEPAGIAGLRLAGNRLIRIPPR